MGNFVNSTFKSNLKSKLPHLYAYIARAHLIYLATAGPLFYRTYLPAVHKSIDRIDHLNFIIILNHLLRIYSCSMAPYAESLLTHNIRQSHTARSQAWMGSRTVSNSNRAREFEFVWVFGSAPWRHTDQASMRRAWIYVCVCTCVRVLGDGEVKALCTHEYCICFLFFSLFCHYFVGVAVAFYFG